MARIFDDNSRSIGGTPLVRLNQVCKGLPATVVGKIEGRNPSYSVKCRIGAAMIWAAEREETDLVGRGGARAFTGPDGAPQRRGAKARATSESRHRRWLQARRARSR